MSRVRQLLEEELDQRSFGPRPASRLIMEEEALREWCGIHAEEVRQRNARMSEIYNLVVPLPIEGVLPPVGVRYACIALVQRLIREELSTSPRALESIRSKSRELMVEEARRAWCEIKDQMLRERNSGTNGTDAREGRRRDAARRRRDATVLEEQRNQPDGIRRREAEWELWMLQRVDDNNLHLAQAQERVRLQRQNIPLDLRESDALRHQAATEHQRRRRAERLARQITTTPVGTLPPTLEQPEPTQTAPAATLPPR